MGGLYNMLFGVNPMTGLLLHILDLHARDIPRMRDAWFDGEHIVILTRAGGNNREDYDEQIVKLRSHPGYVTDEDDTFDSTYATFTFVVPDHGGFPPEYIKESLKEMMEQMGLKPPRPLKERFEEAMKEPAT